MRAGVCETDLQLMQGYMGFQGVLGHEFVGIAEEGPLKGQRVVGEINCNCWSCDYCDAGLANHCPNRSVLGILNHDGAFADYITVPSRNLHRVPEEISTDEDWTGLSDLTSAAWALASYMNEGREEDPIAVKPMALLVGVEAPVPVRVYQKKGMLEVLQIGADSLKGFAKTKDPDRRVALATQFLERLQPGEASLEARST